MNPVAIFEQERDRLTGLAYRMLGSVADAEDVVQEAWLRWNRSATGEIAQPSAWLMRIVSRLCLDRLRSATRTREHYVGPWLPEPLVEEMEEHSPSPAEALERADDVTVAFLLSLERLSPLERAVFLLHDVFSGDYSEVAATLGRSEAACRQIASRARKQLQAARPRFKVGEDRAKLLIQSFLTALREDDGSQLSTLLAEDAILVSDGGGKAVAALNPVLGRDRVQRFLLGIARRVEDRASAQLRLVWINRLPGFIIKTDEGVSAFALQPDPDGQISAVYSFRNPDKLGHIHF